MSQAEEVERKFRLSQMPPSDLLVRGLRVEQGYVVVDPGDLRIRRAAGIWSLTVTGDGDLTRGEWEPKDEEIGEWVGPLLWEHTVGARLEKTRYRVPYAGFVLEVDVFIGSLTGLILLECEFKGETTELAEEQARRFVLPPWASNAIDVTQNPAYKNKSLALKGLPV